nr:MAG TPA: hypothetical protein [Caudoviricetes sp.]
MAKLGGFCHARRKNMINQYKTPRSRLLFARACLLVPV